MCVLIELLGRSVPAIDRRIDRLAGRPSNQKPLKISAPSHFPRRSRRRLLLAARWSVPTASVGLLAWLGKCHRTQAGRPGVCIRAGRLVVGVAGRAGRQQAMPAKAAERERREASLSSFGGSRPPAAVARRLERPTCESIHPTPMHAWPVLASAGTQPTSTHCFGRSIGSRLGVGTMIPSPLNFFFGTDETLNPNPEHTPSLHRGVGYVLLSHSIARAHH